MKEYRFIIILGLFIVIIVGGIALIISDRLSFAAPLRGDTVRITDEGFIPIVLEVKFGTTVYFVNETSEWRWPASNIHPSHTIYPELDPKETIPPGEEWAFTFNRVGEWNIHDHLAPYVTGKIIVVEE